MLRIPTREERHEAVRESRGLRALPLLQLGVLLVVAGAAVALGLIVEERTESVNLYAQQIRALQIDIERNREIVFERQLASQRRELAGRPTVSPGDVLALVGGRAELEDLVERARILSSDPVEQAARGRVRRALDSADRQVVAAVGDGAISAERKDRLIAVLEELRDSTEGWVVELRRIERQASDEARSTISGLVQLTTWLVAALAMVGALVWALVDRIRKRVLRAALRSETRFRGLTENSSDLVLVVDSQGVVTYCSPSVRILLGFSPAEIEGLALSGLVHPSDRPALVALDVAPGGERPSASIAWRLRCPDGSWRDFETLAADRREDPAIRGWVLNSRDVTDRTAVEEQLVHQAFHDGLTGIGNRVLFEDRLGRALKAARQSGERVAVLVVDLDDFKTLNDGLGHAVGDRLLACAAERLAGGLREGDSVARLGGDEFAVLIEGVGSDGEAVAAARRLRRALAEPLEVDGHRVVLSAAIGIAVAEPEDAAHPGEVLRDADVALYAAKAGGEAYRLFDPALREAAAERVRLKTDLQQALERNQLWLAYQPIVQLSDGSPAGAEALLRWNHPELGSIPPDRFVPLAEDCGLIHPIGEWVLNEATRQLARWREEDPSAAGLYISVNVSAHQLQRGRLPDLVRSALWASGLDPGAVVIELTESALGGDLEAMALRLDALRATGVRIAIDDFGTGYSSLSYLSRLPVDIVKIDKSFVDGVEGGARDAELAGTIVELGSMMNLTTVAEGIEEERQVAALRRMRCAQGQGYHFARPAPGEDFLELLAPPADGARPVPATSRPRPHGGAASGSGGADGA